MSWTVKVQLWRPRQEETIRTQKPINPNLEKLADPRRPNPTMKGGGVLDFQDLILYIFMFRDVFIHWQIRCILLCSMIFSDKSIWLHMCAKKPWDWTTIYSLTIIKVWDHETLFKMLTISNYCIVFLQSHSCDKSLNVGTKCFVETFIKF